MRSRRGAYVEGPLYPTVMTHRLLLTAVLALGLAACDAADPAAPEAAAAHPPTTANSFTDDVDIVVAPTSPCSGSFYNVTANTTGSTPVSYTWYKDGQPYGSNTSRLPEVGTNVDGQVITYSVYVQFSSGATDGNNTAVTLRYCGDEPPPPSDDDDPPTDEEYCSAYPEQCYIDDDGNPTPWLPPGGAGDPWGN